MSDQTPRENSVSKRAPYLSYLLRVWRTDQSGAAGWQASLEDPHTGRRLGFASLEQLFVFLMEQTEKL